MSEEIDEARVLSDVVAALRPLSPEAQRRMLQTLATFFNISGFSIPDRPKEPPQPAQIGSFSQDRSASAKEFLHEKNPESETERLVCLAYYITHYRGIGHFRTIDLTQLNTEAAQIKFSNASATVHSATVQGLIGPAPDGQKQVTARGERFVTLLPDREAARALLEKRTSRRRKRRPISPKSNESA